MAAQGVVAELYPGRLLALEAKDGSPTLSTFTVGMGRIQPTVCAEIPWTNDGTKRFREWRVGRVFDFGAHCRLLPCPCGIRTLAAADRQARGRRLSARGRLRRACALAVASECQAWLRIACAISWTSGLSISGSSSTNQGMRRTIRRPPPSRSGWMSLMSPSPSPLIRLVHTQLIQFDPS